VTNGSGLIELLLQLRAGERPAVVVFFGGYNDVEAATRNGRAGATKVEREAARAFGVGARVSSFGNPYLEVVADRGKFTHDVQVLSTLFLPVDVHGQRSARVGEADRLLEWRQLSRVEMQSRAMAEAVLRSRR
jgi:hypothetical protein